MGHGIDSKYIENKVNSRDSKERPYWKISMSIDGWQVPAYKAVAGELRMHAKGKLVELGCGSGFKGMRHLAPETIEYVGVDQESGIALAKKAFPNGQFYSADLENRNELVSVLNLVRPKYVVCLDVLEHLDDPSAFISALSETLPATEFYWSTPNRLKVPGNPVCGPPKNSLHVREWSSEELLNLFKLHKHTILEHRDLVPYQDVNFFKNTLRYILVSIRNLVKWRVIGIPKYSQFVITRTS